MRCVATAELRTRIEDLLSDEVGFQRITTFEQAEALIAVAIGLLDYRGGPHERAQALVRAHEMVDRCREAAVRRPTQAR